MFQLTGNPLPVQATLPAGAYKLYHAAQQEPRATQSRYAAMIGYSERSIRSFTAALVEAGVAARILPNTRKSEPESAIIRELIAFGLNAQKARALADRHPEALLREGMNAAQQAYNVQNPPGYLIWWLDNRPVEFAPVTVVEAKQPVVVESVPAQSSVAMILCDDVLCVTDDNREAVLLAYAVEEATGADLRLNPEARETAEQLYRAGYRADEVALYAEVIFRREDWRGRQGERVTSARLREGIAAARNWKEYPITIRGSLQERIKAIRMYLPDDFLMRSLRELWGEQIRADFYGS